MHRAHWLRSWRRLAVQAGLLAGIAVSFVGTTPPPIDAAPPSCEPESACMLKKPLLLFVLDYSTSMNQDLVCPTTRWQAARAAVQHAVLFDNGHLAAHHILGLMRFGHDPNPQGVATPIPGDTSGLHDGHNIDVGFYDPDLPGKPYFECLQGQTIAEVLYDLPPPLGGQLVGIESWTRGALQHARAYLNLTRFDHPGDADRLASIVLLTDGPWTNQQGTQQLAPAGENPATVAAALFQQDGVPVHVITLGEAAGHPFADELAAMGGTGQPLAAATPSQLAAAAEAAAVDATAEQVTPVCAPKLARIMILLDASSSMLNLQGGAVRAPMGQGGWEQVRDALAGPYSMFDIDLPNGKAGELGLFGLAVFGSQVPDESKRVVQYGQCHKDNVAWALDPATSCGDGCPDPYAPAPIAWTFQDGSLVPPFFADPTISHVPTCNQGNPPNLGCFGSATYTHTGLLEVQTNLAAYKAACADPQSPQPCAPDTPFINILITDGQTNSTQPQYTAPLVEMFNNGVTTHVIGLGDGVDTPAAKLTLEDMADKGSGGLLDYYDANNQAQLEAALVTILEASLPAISSCCMLDCSADNDSFGPEPDPLPPDSFGCTDDQITGSSTTTGGTTTTGETTADATTLDTGTTRQVTLSGSSDDSSDTATTIEPPASTASATSDPSGASTSSPPTGDATEPEPTTPTSTDPPTSGPGSGDTASDPPQTADPGCGCRHDATGGLLALLPFALVRRRRDPCRPSRSLPGPR